MSRHHSKEGCGADEPISSAWPVASDWLETFLHDGGNRWDHRIASVMTANAAVTASAVITDAIRWSQRFPPSCRKVSSQSLATGHALLIGWSRMHSNSVMRGIS